MPKILLIDDERFHITALKDKFESEGFEVFVAENGKIGVEVAVKEKPDFIILDVLMPVQNGKVTLRDLKELPETKDIPIIILTAVPESSLQEESDRAVFSQAVEVLQKDQLRLDDLVLKVKEYLKV